MEIHPGIWNTFPTQDKGGQVIGGRGTVAARAFPVEEDCSGSNSMQRRSWGFI